MTGKSSRRAALAMLALALTVPAVASAQTVVTTSAGPAQLFQAAGPNAASIQGTVDAFRAALGAPNANVAGSFGTGRREINWDGVPDAASDPNPFPPDFFNTVSPRGAVFSTPGRGLLVSADSSNPTNTPVEFGRFNADYPTQFATFSPPRLFTARPQSNIVTTRFFIPGSPTRAVTTGFGAVFTDVDLARSTLVEFADERGRLLLRRFVPSSPGTGSLSFLGLVFGDAVLARVRIVSGNVGLSRDDQPGRGFDAVVMDDFIYGEPRLP
jgi:hypothetical protein